MEYAIEYIFKISALDTKVLLKEVSQALEKRTELISRAKYPDIWKYTDKFNASKKASQSTLKKRRVFTKIYSILNLLLGTFLFIPSLMEPKKLFIPLLVGAIAIGFGIRGMWRSRKNKKNPFVTSAELLLKEREHIAGDEVQVVFTENGMRIETQETDTAIVPYLNFEYVIETEETFLLTYQGNVTILQKRDMVTGNRNDFNDFISSKVELVGV